VGALVARAEGSRGQGMAGDAFEAARDAAEQRRLRYVDLSRVAVNPGASSLLPEETARRYQAVAIEQRQGATVVAVADPTQPEVLDALRRDIVGDLVVVVAPAEQVSAAITRVYGGGQLRGARQRGDPEAIGAHVVPEAPVDWRAPARHVRDDPSPAAGANGSVAHPEPGGVDGRTPRGWPTASGFPPPRGVPGPAPANGRSGPAGPAAVPPAPADGPGSLEESLREVLAPPDVGVDVGIGTGVGADPPPPPAPEADPGADVASPRPAPRDAPVQGADRALGGADSSDPELRVARGVPAHAPGSTGGQTPQPPQAGEPDAAAARTPEPQLHWPPLARVLVASGKVSYDDMVQALRAHQEAGSSLAGYLYNRQLATEQDLVEAMAQEVGLEFVDLGTFPVDPAVAGLIPVAVARRHMVLPIKIENGVPVVAMANPTDVFAMDDLRSIMGRNFTPVVATRSEIASHLRQRQDADSNVEEAAQSAEGVVGPSGGFELESLHSVVEDAPIVRYVNLLILQALNERASDIHIEPSPRRLRIRFRIDGVMHDASSASPAIHASVVSRLKVLGEMDITEHRIPQEGRVSLAVGDRQIDLRLATLPSMYGETCVMRLLDKSASIRRLSELGFLSDTAERYAQTYNHPYGVILVTGPTGAGKTTTLYATLQEVMSKEKSVVTVEDPVEYQIDGITQVQINSKAGLQFSNALRSILRADPDIILVGEIRDIDTASIAMEAALSGHLVLSTLHTNTAAATPLRLTEMGIEPFLVTSAVSGVLTQRLARVLCERCKTPYASSLADFYAAGYHEEDLEGLDTSTLYRANGCRACSHTGYYGRMVLAEVMQVTEEIERMIIEQQSIVAMERQAVEQGMRTLRYDGLLKALMGTTTLEEVLRVVV
jgi:type IV pilus assembly protein PilB